LARTMLTTTATDRFTPRFLSIGVPSARLPPSAAQTLLNCPLRDIRALRPVAGGVARDGVQGLEGRALGIWNLGSSRKDEEMSRLIVATSLTLDGVMQAPGGPGEDSDGFEYGGWSVNYWDDVMGTAMAEATTKPFAMVLGRTTYDIMAAFWPNAPDE